MSDERMKEIKDWIDGPLWRALSRDAARELAAEIDRLRAENAELKEAAAGAWRDLDEDCYPEDETDVLWLEKFNNGRGPERRVTVSRMSRRCGAYGPSHAVAFAEIKMPEEPKP